MWEALWGLPVCSSHTQAQPFLEAEWQALSIFKASDSLFAVPPPHSQDTIAVIPARRGNGCCFVFVLALLCRGKCTRLLQTTVLPQPVLQSELYLLSLPPFFKKIWFEVLGIES